MAGYIGFLMISRGQRTELHGIYMERQRNSETVAPILISLENHCGAQGQLRLAQIMKEVLGDRLLTQAVREKGTREQEGTGEHVTLAELGNKVVVIVEYHLPNEEDTSDTSESSSEDEEEKKAHQQYRDRKKTSKSSIIVPELAELGIWYTSPFEQKDRLY